MASLRAEILGGKEFPCFFAWHFGLLAGNSAVIVYNAVRDLGCAGLKSGPSRVDGPHMCDNLVLRWMTETRQT